VLSAADFGLVAESIPQVVWMAAADGSTVSFNHRGTEYAGLARTAKGSSWLALVHPADADRAALVWREPVSTGNPYEIECRLRRADGAFRWQACSALPVHGSDGEIVGWMGTFTEIEDRHRLAESLRAAERQGAESVSLLETLQSSAPAGLGFVDREFRVIRMNDALAATNGIPSEQQLGRTVEETIPRLWPQLGPIYERVLETGLRSRQIGHIGGSRTEIWCPAVRPGSDIACQSVRSK
jgi:PAS domain S-box-containing protein